MDWSGHFSGRQRPLLRRSLRKLKCDESKDFEWDTMPPSWKRINFWRLIDWAALAILFHSAGSEQLSEYSNQMTSSRQEMEYRPIVCRLLIRPIGFDVTLHRNLEAQIRIRRWETIQAADVNPPVDKDDAPAPCNLEKSTKSLWWPQVTNWMRLSVGVVCESENVWQ